MRNGISAAGLSELMHEIRAEPVQGVARYGVAVQWQSGTRAQARTLPMRLGAQRITREFAWSIDEPRPLGGSNHGPSPQELLLSGLGACLMVGFAVGATVQGIQLAHLEVELHAELDLAGFLDARPGAPVPLAGIDYTLHVAGDGTPAQFEALREAAEAHSPNAMSLARGVPLAGRLHLVEGL